MKEITIKKIRTMTIAEREKWNMRKYYWTSSDFWDGTVLVFETDQNVSLKDSEFIVKKISGNLLLKSLEYRNAYGMRHAHIHFIIDNQIDDLYDHGVNTTLRDYFCNIYTGLCPDEYYELRIMPINHRVYYKEFKQFNCFTEKCKNILKNSPDIYQKSDHVFNIRGSYPPIILDILPHDTVDKNYCVDIIGFEYLKRKDPLFEMTIDKQGNVTKFKKSDECDCIVTDHIRDLFSVIGESD